MTTTSVSGDKLNHPRDIAPVALELVGRNGRMYPGPQWPQPSSIDSLPDDVLGEIFNLGRTKNCFGLPCGLPLAPPEVLYSHVSRRWYDIATNLPTLWTRIHVNARLSLLWLPHYLSRSQRCHLDIWINHRDLDKYCGLEGRMNKIIYTMNLLIPHIDRWSSLRVQGHFEYSSYSVLSHLDYLRAPVLRHLAVDFDVGMGSMGAVGVSFPLEILQGGAPLLTSITRLDTHRCCRPPVSALTTCTISRFRRSPACMQFIQALASSHALTKLHVCGGYGYIESVGFNGLSRTQLDTLKSLRLNRTSHLTSLLLLAISAPHLETLWLGSLRPDDLHMFSLVSNSEVHT